MRSLLVLLGALALPAHAWPGAGQVAPSRLDVGSASVAGVVVDDNDPVGPVAGAAVVLSPVGSDLRLTVVADDQGRFHIGAVPPGLYRLTATNAGYLPSAYGTSRPLRPGAVLTLKEGQHLADLRLTMIRGGQITGRVLSAGGGVPGATVLALHESPVPRVDLGGSSAVTDSTGSYRLYDLPPGAYTIVAAMPRSDVFRDVAEASTRQVSDALADLERRQSGIVRPVVATPISRPAPVRGFRSVVFYPGVANQPEALAVKVGPNEARHGVDISAVESPLVDLSGVVVGPPGAGLADVIVTLSQEGMSLLPTSAAEWLKPRSARVDAAGGFMFAAVAPGRYVLEARTIPRRSDGNSGSTPETFWGSMEVDVGADHVDGLMLNLFRTPQIEGRTHFLGSSPPSPADLARVRLSLSRPLLSATFTPALQAVLGTPGLPSGVQVSREGTFVMRDVPPGQYILKVSSVPAGWRLASVRVGGRESLDDSLQVGLSDLPSVEVVFSDRTTLLSGSLQVPQDEAASSYALLVVPANPSLWAPDSRRMRWTRPNLNGTFRVSDLPPGDYVVGVVDDFDEQDLRDPKFLTELVGSGVRIVIREGEETVQVLKVTRPPTTKD